VGKVYSPEKLDKWARRLGFVKFRNVKEV